MVVHQQSEHRAGIFLLGVGTNSNALRRRSKSTANYSTAPGADCYTRAYDHARRIIVHGNRRLE
jgi:hypothetical protein